MKIQCDVCNKEEAFVFCSADEAALCKGCDHRVHHANKLASKHHRFSLLNPTEKDVPLCDICQERRGLLFCKEDRAILCRECDIPIHTANELTKKHNRFILTGVKIGTSSCASQTLSEDTDVVPTSAAAETNISSGGGGGSVSSIAQYLIETLPGSGWQVEDLLDSTTSSASNDFSKVDDFMPMPLVGNFTCDDVWVPHIPPYQLNQIIEQHNEQQINKSNSTAKINKRWSDSNNHFTVPEMSHQPNKRNRSFW